jgi:glycosyltransferase involved in cell wall biosynthesis
MARTPILFVIDAMARGGTELQLRGLIDRLDRSQFEPHLLTLRNRDASLVPKDCAHLDLQVSSLMSPDTARALMRTVRYLRHHRIQVVQTFFQDSTLFGGTAARLAGVPMRLVSFRDLGFWRTPGQEVALRMVYRLATGFVANSIAVRDHFCEVDGLDPARFALIPNGLDVVRFTFRPPADPPRVVGILGNLNREVKRIDLFVEAAGMLAPRHPDVRWEVVGDGHLRPALESRASALGLGDSMVFHGQLANVDGVLGCWDIGVLCSDTEGFSNALLEYMLCGCAAVATDVGGNREAIRHEISGILVPLGSAAALATGLERLLAGGDLPQRMAATARTEAEHRYSWDACLAAHETLYSGATAVKAAFGRRPENRPQRRDSGQ